MKACDLEQEVLALGKAVVALQRQQSKKKQTTSAVEAELKQTLQRFFSIVQKDCARLSPVTIFAFLMLGFLLGCLLSSRKGGC